MKAKKIETAIEIGNYFRIKFEGSRDSYRVDIPKELIGKKYEIRKGKLYVGGYVYNSEKDTWEVVSKILRFLLSIVESIKNIFSK